MTALVCSGVATAVAVWLRRPDDWVVLQCRLGRNMATDRPWSLPRWLPAVAATSVVVVAVPAATTQVALVAMVATGWFALTLRRAAHLRTAAAEFRAEVARVVRAAAAELRAGSDPADALRAASERESATWVTIRSAGSADMATALQTTAVTPGGENLAEIAAAWHLAEQAGAPLAVILDRMAGSIQDEVDLAREVGVEAGPARATARLMAALPVFGLGLGFLLGVNPLAVLLGSGLGVACLVAGLGLAAGGVWWIERIVLSVEAA